MARITCRAQADAPSRDVGACRLTAHGTFGTATVIAEQAKGHPDLPLTDVELMEKFTLNVELAGIFDAAAHAAGARLLRLDREASVDFLLISRSAFHESIGRNVP